MEQRISFTLKTLAMAVWSAMLLYFAFTNQLPYFLAREFRPLVWVAGVVLAVLTVCYAIFARPSQRSQELECEHHHEENSHIQITSFLVLVLPISLAMIMTPDSYSRSVIANRGINSGAVGRDSQLAQWAANMARGREEIYAPDAEFLAPVTDLDAPSNGSLGEGNGVDSRPEDAMLDPGNADLTRSMPVEPLEPPLPGTEAAGATTAVTTEKDAVDYMRAYLAQLEKDEQGYTRLETTDLTYAATDPAFRQALTGKPVVVLGQYYPAGGASAEKIAYSQGPGQEPIAASPGSSYFWAVRMTMSCCAADARPAAVKVDTSQKQMGAIEEMAWITTRGKVEFRPATEKAPGSSGQTWEPWIRLDEIKSAERPSEIYLF